MNNVLDLDDFTFDLQTNGNLYVSSDINGFSNKTFILDELGNLFFNDEVVWTGEYYVLQSDGFYKLHEEETNV